MLTVRGLLVAGPVTGPVAVGALVARVSAGVVLVVFGQVKFTDRALEVAEFERYGLPAPEVFVAVVGTVEVVGGVLLIVGLLVRPTALVLCGNMLGAIVTSGIGQGEVVPSLTVAPAVLALLVFLLWARPGIASVDRRLFKAAPAVGAAHG